jgi:hypothetical protein
MPEMTIPDHTGHRSFTWSTTDDVAVASAVSEFARLQAEGRVPFAVQPGGADPVQVHQFDPSADHDLIWLRPIAGG